MRKKLIPTFAHGTLAQVRQGIEDGRLKYPSYIWLDDSDQYAFLNKTGELEICAMPKYVGTLENPIILSSLNDGLYEISGQHKITADHLTTFDSSGFILVVVQTVDDVKKVRRITADEMSEYIIDGEEVTVNEVATKEYLDEHGYMTEPDVDAKIAAMKVVIMADVEAALPDMIEPIIRPVVEEVVQESIQPESDDNIRHLFDE